MASETQSAAGPSLASLQVWMQGVILQSRPSSHSSRSVVRDLPALSAPQCLQIYNDACRLRLLGCLKDEFPVLCAAVGDDAFTQFSLGYIRERPSRSYTLGHFSQSFVEYLASSRPAQDDSDAGSIDWTDVILELALLEHTINVVFDGPGSEKASRRSRTGQDQDDVRADSVIEINPSVKVLRLSFPVHTYYSALRAGGAPAVPSPVETRLAVYRENYVVRFIDLDRTVYSLLEQLLSGESLSSALCRLACAVDRPEASSSELVFQAMHRLGELGLLRLK